MKSKMFKKIMAAALATAMTAGLAGCANNNAPASASSDESNAPSIEEASSEDASTEQSSEEEVSSEEDGELGQYTVLKDENGNVYDLGGMEIVIRNWWSGEPTEPTNDYQEAERDYREWIQETYNFKIKEQAISDWGSAPTDFVEYVTTGGDDNNYVFILRDDAATTGAMANGLMYDLATIKCLDFSQEKFQANKTHEMYSTGNSIWAMYAGTSEPRTGVFFNKRVLSDAGIDPESIYDLQASGEWTWDKWVEIMGQVQRDIDNDGVIDVYGTTQNSGAIVSQAVYSNGGEWIGKDADGKFLYRLEDPETLEALEWWTMILTDYALPYPEDAQWDYYKEGFLNGEAAFCPEDAYAGVNADAFLHDMKDDYGFVMFPKGPQMDDYVNCWTNNPAVIPACYDAERAEKIAFAWNLFTDPIPGYEDYEGWKATYYNGMRDTRSVDETSQMMTEKGMVSYVGVVPNVEIGPNIAWNIAKGNVVSEQVEKIRDTWKQYIDEANSKIQ